MPGGRSEQTVGELATTETYHRFLGNKAASNASTVGTLIRSHGIRAESVRRISVNHPCDEPVFGCGRFCPVLKTELGEDLPGTLEHVIGYIGQSRHGLLSVVDLVS